MIFFKRKLLLVLAPCVLATSFQTQAEVLQVEYKSFYSHVKKLKSEETNALQFAFGFMNIHSKSLCTITEARISTEKQQIPLNISPESRFTVPSERALRLADALIVIDLLEPANTCDMSVQLETKPEFLKVTYSQKELQHINQQYAAFFDEMGGFMSFMMPKVSGISILFEDKSLQQQLASGLVIENGVLSIGLKEIEGLSQISLPEKPLRITAMTTK